MISEMFGHALQRTVQRCKITKQNGAIYGKALRNKTEH